MREVHAKGPEVKTAYVDIDETICFYDGERVYQDAIPNLGNIAKINKLYDEGWRIVYWSARGSTQKDNMWRMGYLRGLTIKQLADWNAKYHQLVLGDQKPFYDLVIDDKAKRIEEL
jgi:hypothetical protein